MRSLRLFLAMIAMMIGMTSLLAMAALKLMEIHGESGLYIATGMFALSLIGTSYFFYCIGVNDGEQNPKVRK